MQDMHASLRYTQHNTSNKKDINNLVNEANEATQHKME